MPNATNTGSPQITEQSIRIICFVILVAPLLVVGVFAAISPIEALGVLLIPAVVAGVVCCPTGYLLYRQLVDGGPAGADRAERLRRFFIGTIVPLALTEAAALLGAMAFSADSRPLALLPVLTHITLAVVIWPSQQRFDNLVGAE